IANRGEIAVRIAQAAADLGIRTLSVYSDDDAQSLHCRRTDATQRLAGVGAQAYLDGEAIIQVALAHGCDAIHPGYGFLSESAAFARRCEQAGLVFVGPTPEMLDVLGDKARARDLARRCGVALLPGTAGGMSLAQVEDFVRELGDTPAAMIKAVSGGGGRGMRVVRSVQEVPQAYARCQSEALRAFGNDSLYVEKLVERARHIEVQVVGDGQHVAHVFERECTLQRRHQKLIEVAPAPGLDPVLRTLILNAALALAREFPYRSLGTFEFLVDQDPALSVAEAFYFMEANPRLQVEHTVTESLTGLDLVQIQLRIAAGQTLHEVGLSAPLPEPEGYAIECRINAESMTEQAQAHPEGGTLERFEPPTGRGVRVDTFAYGGYRTHPGFDSLLAKLIVRCEGPNFDLAIARTRRVLREFTIKGVRTNLDVLDALLGMEQVAHNAIHTTFIESNIAQILARAQQSPLRWVAHACKGDADDNASIQQAGSSSTSSAPAGAIAVTAPLQGKLCSLMCEAGAVVGAQDVLLVIESMKMEHSVLAG
ncbi:MAG: biotin/lipoyl-binding protein, partial [Comamonadaceae bacterium]